MTNKQEKLLKLFLAPLNILGPFSTAYLTYIGYPWYLTPIITFVSLGIITFIVGIIYYIICDYLNKEV